MGRQATLLWSPRGPRTCSRVFAHGFSDDLVATTVLATSAPVIVVPAMETHMLAKPGDAKRTSHASRARRFA